jgi:hypothetical protein
VSYPNLTGIYFDMSGKDHTIATLLKVSSTAGDSQVREAWVVRMINLPPFFVHYYRLKYTTISLQCIGFVGAAMNMLNLDLADKWVAVALSTDAANAALTMYAQVAGGEYIGSVSSSGPISLEMNPLTDVVWLGSTEAAAGKEPYHELSNFIIVKGAWDTAQFSKWASNPAAWARYEGISPPVYDAVCPDSEVEIFEAVGSDVEIGEAVGSDVEVAVAVGSDAAVGEAVGSTASIFPAVDGEIDICEVD